jgi:hypothetical protein
MSLYSIGRKTATKPFLELREWLKATWWRVTNPFTAIRYRLERRGVYIYWEYWVWPQTTFRFNSSLMWGASPYKEWAFGPVRYRKYL